MSQARRVLCPACGANLAASRTGFACGSRLLHPARPEPQRPAPPVHIHVNFAVNFANVENWRRLARVAAAADNHEEAYHFYTKVLEVDSDNAEAWFGKAKAAGWRSTLKTFRLPEMLVGLRQAITCTPLEEVRALEVAASEALNEVAVALFKLAARHARQYLALDGVWLDYLGRCEAIMRALAVAGNLDPRHQAVHENLVHICKTNIEGVVYYDNDGQKLELAEVEEGYEEVLRARLERAVGHLQKLRPGYRRPKIRKASMGYSPALAIFVMIGILLLAVWVFSQYPRGFK